MDGVAGVEVVEDDEPLLESDVEEELSLLFDSLFDDDVELSPPVCFPFCE